VAPVLEWNSEIPTVLQSLTYWIASAMGLPGAWVIPNFYESIKNLTTNPSIPLPGEEKFSHARSESSWVVTNAAGFVPSSAGIITSPILSEAGLHILPSHLDSNTSPLRHKDIVRWADAAPQGSLNAASLVIPISPAGTKSLWSELTADAGNSVANLVVDSTYHGDWMSLPFSQRAATFELGE